MRPTGTTVPARVVVTVAAAMVAIGVGGCSPADRYRENIVTGTFDSGKLIALNHWVGTNTSSVGTVIEAYADVSDQTPGNLDLNGPQHWRCTGVFRPPSDVPPTGGLFESDQDRTRDKVVSLPARVRTGETAKGVGFAGPPGTYRVTIEVPSLAAKFSHTWKFLGPDSPPGALYHNAPACTQIV